MKPWKLIVCLLILAPVGILTAGFLIFRSGVSCNLMVLDSVTLRDGDLVFRRGKSIESLAVLVADNNAAYSHIGMIIMNGKKPFAIHVEPAENNDPDDRVKEESLIDFLGNEKASHFAIYRSHLRKEGLSRATVKAKSFFYGKIRFDNSYDLLTDQRMYCSELILKAYQYGDPTINSILSNMEDVGILVARRKILMPGAFIRSRIFYKICSQ
ncbi:MAG: YiiX/YebB-like N1pC/P60 family cysteine hydrolase [Bacteroidota bacterium]